MAQTAALPILSGETCFTGYLEGIIRQFPMLEPQKNSCWRSVGAGTATATLRTGLSPAIDGKSHVAAA
jgi:hypothetical protein